MNQSDSLETRQRRYAEAEKELRKAQINYHVVSALYFQVLLSQTETGSTAYSSVVMSQIRAEREAATARKDFALEQYQKADMALGVGPDDPEPIESLIRQQEAGYRRDNS